MLFALVFGFSACAEPPEQAKVISGTKAAADKTMFDAAIAETKSEFVKNVLKDYVITAEELYEAMSRTSKCLTEHGIEQSVERDANGDPFILIAVDADKGKEKESRECEKQWLGQIEYLARGGIINVGDVNDQILVAECLVRMGIVPEGFTAHDLAEVVAVGEEEFTLYFDDNGEVIPSERPIPTETAISMLPGGIPLFENELTTPCLTDPRSAGLEPAK